MQAQIQYLTDSEGHKTSVLVPIKQWEKLNRDLEVLKNTMAVFNSIKEGIAEIKQAKKEGRKLPTLSEFIHENGG